MGLREPTYGNFAGAGTTVHVHTAAHVHVAVVHAAVVAVVHVDVVHADDGY